MLVVLDAASQRLSYVELFISFASHFHVTYFINLRKVALHIEWIFQDVFN